MNPQATHTCAHQRGHITDSRFYGDRYATPASRRIFCDDCRNQRWLDIEAALALAQGGLGVIPQWAAEAIAASAKLENLDLNEVQAEIERTGHSLVGLLRVFETACPDGAGQYIHYGATTQDIQDTGQVLEMRDVLDELDRTLDVIVETLADLADKHASTLATGRTHARAALPMAFGLKVAGWLDEILRDAARLRQMRPRILVVQLFGGVGTMAGFGPHAREVLEGVAGRLGIGVPEIGWHVARDRVVEYVSALALLAGTMGRIGEEVRILGRPEFGEVTEAWQYGKVGSSTMPHKRNPERCEQVVALSKLAAAQPAIALAGMAGDHERDSRTLRVEWACVPDVSHYALAATEIVKEIVTGLTVNVDRLRENAREVADQIASERLMLALGERIGKQYAHERVYALSQAAQDRRVSMQQLLAEEGDLADLLDKETLDEVFDPSQYLGASTELARRTVTQALVWLDGRR